MDPNLQQAYNDIIARLKELDSAVLAFSGGVDSVLLLNLLHNSGLKRLVAVTVLSDSFTEAQKSTAQDYCASLSVEHRFIESDEMEDQDFLANDPRRCYYCKLSMFKALKSFASDEGVDNVLEASHISDLEDYRPGLEAVDKLGIMSPFRELSWDKSMIRAVSKELDINGYGRAPTVCLSSRVPYGTPISSELLEKIARAEQFLIESGFEKVRVRSDGIWARIEVSDNQLQKISEMNFRNELIKKYKQIGFCYISLDLEGYESGKMNRVLEYEKR